MLTRAPQRPLQRIDRLGHHVHRRQFAVDFRNHRFTHRRHVAQNAAGKRNARERRSLRLRSAQPPEHQHRILSENASRRLQHSRRRGIASFNWPHRPPAPGWRSPAAARHALTPPGGSSRGSPSARKSCRVNR